MIYNVDLSEMALQTFDVGIETDSLKGTLLNE